MSKPRNSSAGSSLIRKSTKDKVSSKSSKTPSCTLKISAVLTRLLFILHTAVALWRVWLVYPPIYIYFLSIGVGCLLVEMTVTVIVRHGREYKWLCPSVFFYLLSVVPCLWLLERAQLDGFAKLPYQIGGCNLSYEATATVLPANLSINASQEMLLRSRRDVEFPTSNLIEGLSDDTNKLLTTDAMILNSTFSIGTGNELPSHHQRHTSLPQDVSRNPGQAGNLDDASNDNKPRSSLERFGDSISGFGQNTLDVFQNATHTVDMFLQQLNPENWLLALHQVLLFVLVIGRWLLPKGEITRDQLSQLLLVFIGVGADILEFVTETMDNEVFDVRCNWLLHYIIYAVWSWSLLQFTLVLTAAKSRKTRVGFSNDRVVMISSRNTCCTNTIFNKADLWGIIVTMMLQDIPFLAFRLYMMIVYQQVHQMMVFFTGKNILVVSLQVYRLVVLQLEHKAPAADDANDTELQPLRGTLKRLARNSSTNSFDGEIKNASFKSKNDGSVVVKIRLESDKVGKHT